MYKLQLCNLYYTSMPTNSHKLYSSISPSLTITTLYILILPLVPGLNHVYADQTGCAFLSFQPSPGPVPKYSTKYVFVLFAP